MQRQAMHEDRDTNLLQVKVHWYYLFLTFVLLLRFILILIHNIILLCVSALSRQYVRNASNISTHLPPCLRQYLYLSLHPPLSSGCVLQIFGRLSHLHLPSSWNNTRITDAPYRTPLYLASEDSGSVTPMTCVVTAYPLSHHPALNWNTLI